MKRILVHCCCGPCATSSIERLLAEGWTPVLLFGNSNIDTVEENERRYENLLKVSEHFGGLEVVRAPYDHRAWLECVRGLEAEPEHGARCVECFRFNLREAMAQARRLGIDRFTTTLTVSRFKNSRVIFSVGEGLEGFEEIDFKKKGGFERSCALSEELGLYRQKYCGCEFSKGNGV